MTRLEDRQILVRDIEQACADGCRLAPACALGGIDTRTLRRWKAGDGLIQGDRRPDAERPVPSHALSEAERAQIVAVANEPRFAETPPARIVPALADEGIYIASESSFHRVLRAHGQMNRRGRAQPPRTSRPPTTHIATRPGDVWCWDVTFLPAQIQGRWFYFYLILDLYSRKIVGFEVHDTDSAEHAAHLARRTALAEGVHAKPVRPVLHGDNGATLKATTVLAMLHWLGIEPSYSRPRVSNDNAFAEALFRTAKYRPEFPLKGARRSGCRPATAGRFVHWYNHEHRHSGIRYVTPAQRHVGQMAPFSPPATRSTRTYGNATPNAGLGRPATGHRLASSPSIRSATASCRRQPHKSSFPVRSARLLSRPDLATPKPRSATQEMEGAEPPGATRSAPCRASMMGLPTR
jgi:putative transposase